MLWTLALSSASSLEVDPAVSATGFSEPLLPPPPHQEPAAPPPPPSLAAAAGAAPWAPVAKGGGPCDAGVASARSRVISTESAALNVADGMRSIALSEWGLPPLPSPCSVGDAPGARTRLAIRSSPPSTKALCSASTFCSTDIWLATK